jgi:hypothetical protein
MPFAKVPRDCRSSIYTLRQGGGTIFYKIIIVEMAKGQVDWKCVF